jgi:cytochrome c-type biogenesis protein CcmH/NrfF
MRIHFRADDSESFIEQTLRNVDQYLRAEQKEEARAEWTEAEQAEYNELMRQDDQQEWDEWLALNCQLHCMPLINGHCPECDAEIADELRNDL